MTNPVFRFERDENRRRTIVTLSVRSTVEVWSSAVAAVISENAWREPAIYDMSAVDSTPLLLNLPNLVPLLGELTKTHGRRDAVAVIVKEADLVHWRQRLAGLFTDLVTVEAFSDSASAHRWLDQIDQRPDVP